MSASTLEAKPKDARSLWAYPRGVIVTTDGGKVEPASVKEGEEPVTPASNEEFRTFNRALVERLSKCLEAARSASPELQKTGGKYSFSGDFTIDKTGKVADLNLTKANGSADLPACADALGKDLAAHTFAAPHEGIGLGAHASYEVVILNDDDAQGHGFQYYEGETKWEALLKANASWFACKQASDCAVTAELCEVRGLRVSALADYRKAIAERKKAACRRPIDLTTYQAKCRGGRCAARKLP